MVVTRLFSWPAKMRMASELRMRPRPDAGDESIASFLGRHFGTEAVERIGEPLLAGIHAGDPERLSMLSAFPRFVDMERRHGSLIRAMWKAPRPRAGGPPAFVSFRSGLGELADALAVRLAGPARTSWRARAVRRVASAWEIEAEDGARVQAGAVVIAVPAAAAARLLREADPGIASALGAFRSVSTAVCYLGYRRGDVAHRLNGYGVVIPRTEGRRVSALGFVSTKFPGRAPQGHVLLRAFLGGARHPDVLAEDDGALVERAFAECAGILGLHGRPVMARVFRWPQATPQMEVGHALAHGVGGRPGRRAAGAVPHRVRNARDRDPGHGRRRRPPGRARGGLSRLRGRGAPSPGAGRGETSAPGARGAPSARPARAGTPASGITANFTVGIAV